MISPLAFVVDIHSGFTLAGGNDEGAIGVDDGFLKEAVVLLLPHIGPSLVDGVHQFDDVVLGEAATEVTSGGGVGYRGNADGVEEDFVVAAQFDVLQASSLAQCVERDVEDMIGLVIRAMHLE